MSLFLCIVCIILLALAYQGVVGPVLGGDGTTPATGRQTKTGGTVVSQEGGKYQEDSTRGILFAGQLLAGTGQAPGTAIGTTACYCLYNPVGSGKRLSIIKRGASYVSGTLGTGVLYDCLCSTVPQTVPSGGTAIVPVCLDAGNVSNTAAVGLPRVTATVTSPSLISAICYLPPMLASSVLGLVANDEDIDGAITVEPGCSYQMQAIAAAGTTPLINPWVWWKELVIVNTQG